MTYKQWRSLEVGDVIKGNSLNYESTITEKYPSRHLNDPTIVFAYSLYPSGHAVIPELWSIVRKNKDMVCI